MQIRQLGGGIGENNSEALNNLDNIKRFITSQVMPDYSRGEFYDKTVLAGTGVDWLQVEEDSFVVTEGYDVYTESYRVEVSPDKVSTYIVGQRNDSTNTNNTRSITISFFCPKGWYFRNRGEKGYLAWIYPLIGAK